MLSFIRAALYPAHCSDVRSPAVLAATEACESLRLSADLNEDLSEWKAIVFDTIRAIKDPEKDCTLGQLDVVDFVPTVPHCTLASLIGLCIRCKLNQELPAGQFKIQLSVVPGSHDSATEISKQINDKERVAAALENPALLSTVQTCIADRDC